MKAHAMERAEAVNEGLRDIGQAADASGVSVKRIRHYEELGLLGDVPRTAANYRLYTAQHVHTLRFIQRARTLGFSVEEIRELLGLWNNKRRSSAAVKAIAMRHVAELNTKIRELQGMADSLQHLAACCAGDHRPDCPILADLERGA